MAKMPTAFNETTKLLAWQLREAAIDHPAFEQRLPLCELTKCRATCCHDGVVLEKEEFEVLSAQGGAEGLLQLQNGSWKTKTIPASGDELAENFPAHFPKTRCVFLDNEHRCYWQLKAMEEKRHPWFYKPTSCWMHPVLLSLQNDRPLLTILSANQDRDEFASQTPCGREISTAPQAKVGLKGELAMLSEISGRDFSGELNAPGLDD